MANIKIPVTVNNKQALIDLIGEFEAVDEKCVVEYTVEKKKDVIIVKVNDNISGECKIIETPAIDPETSEEFVMLKEFTYNFELIDGTKFSVVSTYLYSIGNIVSRMFYKILSAAKAKYGPVRSSANSEAKAKLREERERYNASKGKKSSKKSTKNEEEVESTEDF